MSPILVTILIFALAVAAWLILRRYVFLPLIALALYAGIAWHTTATFPWRGCDAMLSQTSCTTLYGAAHGIGDGLVGFQAWVQAQANSTQTGGNGK